MAQYMLISHHPAEIPEDFDLSPEVIQAVIRKYNDWTEQLQRSGKLVGLNKLADEPGRNVVGFGERQTVTDGPYAEAKEIIGGYWIVEAGSYDEAVELARDCPSLEYGGRIEVREVADLSALG